MEPPVTAFPKPTKANRLPKPLRRRKPMRKKRARRIDRQTPEDRRYLEFVHTLPCVAGTPTFQRGMALARGLRPFPCGGRIEASHDRNPAGQLPTGMGRKEPDSRIVAMCSEHHRQWEQHRGAFEPWSKEDRQRWMSAAIEDTRSLYEASEGRDTP